MFATSKTAAMGASNSDEDHTDHSAESDIEDCIVVEPTPQQDAKNEVLIVACG